MSDAMSPGNTVVSYFYDGEYIGIEMSNESQQLQEMIIELSGDDMDELGRAEKDGMKFLLFPKGSKGYALLEGFYLKIGRDASAVGH